MFKVKDKKTKEIIQVLDTYCDEFGNAWFLVWSDGWRWYSASRFIPPNYNIEEKV